MRSSFIFYGNVHNVVADILHIWYFLFLLFIGISRLEGGPGKIIQLRKMLNQKTNAQKNTENNYIIYFD